MVWTCNVGNCSTCADQGHEKWHYQSVCVEMCLAVFMAVEEYWQCFVVVCGYKWKRAYHVSTFQGRGTTLLFVVVCCLSVCIFILLWLPSCFERTECQIQSLCKQSCHWPHCSTCLASDWKLHMQSIMRHQMVTLTKNVFTWLVMVSFCLVWLCSLPGLVCSRYEHPAEKWPCGWLSDFVNCAKSWSWKSGHCLSECVQCEL